MNALKAHGHFERYARALPHDDLTALVSSTANSWVPIRLALSHYRACETLDLADEAIFANGGEVVRSLQRTFIGTVLRSAASGAGVTTLVAIKKFATVYSRTIKGGGARIVRIGPKDVRVEFVGLPLASIRYFRISHRGFLQAGCEFFAQRAVVAELDRYLTGTTLAYRVAWA